jgi:hypothetical protein
MLEQVFAQACFATLKSGPDLSHASFDSQFLGRHTFQVNALLPGDQFFRALRQHLLMP